MNNTRDPDWVRKITQIIENCITWVNYNCESEFSKWKLGNIKISIYICVGVYIKTYETFVYKQAW